MFKKGDKVWSVDFGWGVVCDVDESKKYPIRAYFASTDSFQTYAMDGRVIAKLFRSLFFDELIIPETAIKKTKWRAEVRKGYYYVQSNGEIGNGCDVREGFSNNLYKCGNYFRTYEEAIDSKFYRVFHEEE